nr:hypothetical protein [Tanacetum cinerariifolium]
MNQLREHEDLLAQQELREQEQAAQEKEEPPQNFDIRQLIREVCDIKVCEEQKQNMEDMILKLLEILLINLKSQRLDKEKQEVKNIVEQPTKRRTRMTESLQNFRVIHKKSSISLNNTSQISSVNAIAPVLPTEEPEYSLSMEDKHLSTILETESDNVIKSSVKNLVQIPSEYEVTSDNENECDVPVKDESSPILTTFSNPIFDYNDDFTSSDDELLSKEDVSIENSKMYLNPLFDDEEINSNKIDLHYFNAESDLIESLSNRDTLFDSSLKFDYLEEFSDEFMPTSIINEERIKREHEEYISLIEKNDSIFLPENESSNFDHHDDPSFPRPPPKPPDVEVFFDFLPDSGVLTTKVVKGISEHYVLMLNILPTLPTLDPDLDFTPSHDFLGSGNKIFDPGIFIEVQSERLLSREEFSISFTFDPFYPVYDILLLFSLENKDNVFKPGILSYLLVSHRDKTTFDFSENPMMIYEGHIPSKVVPDLHTIPMDK